MTDPTALMDALGPPPFRFTPSRAGLESPAFSPLFRTFATLIVGGCAAWVLRLWSSGAMETGSGLAWVAAGLAMMFWTWWHIQTSRTRLDADGLRQRWIWDKALPLRELAFCKLIRIPGLDWLVAPRLYARTLTGKFQVFYAASPEMLAEFARLKRELETFRRGG